MVAAAWALPLKLGASRMPNAAESTMLYTGKLPSREIARTLPGKKSPTPARRSLCLPPPRIRRRRPQKSKTEDRKHSQAGSVRRCSARPHPPASKRCLPPCVHPHAVRAQHHNLGRMHRTARCGRRPRVLAYRTAASMRFPQTMLFRENAHQPRHPCLVLGRRYFEPGSWIGSLMA